MRKVYLGDNVYLAWPDGWRYLKLTTEYGEPEGPSNTIFLEPEVIRALVQTLKEWELV